MKEPNKKGVIACMGTVFVLTNENLFQQEKDKDAEMGENNCGLASLNRAHASPTKTHNSPQKLQFSFTFLIPAPLSTSTSKNLYIKKSAGVGTPVPAPKQLFYQSARRAECKSAL